MKTKLFLFATIVVLFTSCNFDGASSYFGKTALNTNLLSGFGSEDFKHLIGSKEANQLVIYDAEYNWVLQDKIVPSLETSTIPSIEKAIEDVKSLKETSDTKEMIERSLALYNYALEKHKNEYIEFGKLVDSGASKIDIELTMLNFDQQYLEEFWELHTSLMDVAIPYAEANGIEVSRY